MAEINEECTHNCDTCGVDCSSREDMSLKAQLNPGSEITKVIGIVSGKGGVGKSMVTSLLAVAAERAGYKVGIMDADITGPSIPTLFGKQEKAMATETAILPVESETGIKLMSVNLILDNEMDPVIWRGPVISGVVQQFWTDVEWGKLDYLFIDMPPGTGDVPLTVFQSLPIDGIVIVSSPQDLVSLIVEKAARMAELMEIPIAGIIENMSYLVCPDCGKEINVFGKSHLDEIAGRHCVDNTLRLPIIPNMAGLCDAGAVENIDEELSGKFEGFLKNLEK